MKVKTDQNVPVEAAEDLREAGHDAVTVDDEGLGGQPDARVADACRAEGRAILTLDLDFADIRVYPPGDYAGIIVLRPSLQTITNTRRLVGQVKGIFGSSMKGRFAFVPDIRDHRDLHCVDIAAQLNTPPARRKVPAHDPTSLLRRRYGTWTCWLPQPADSKRSRPIARSRAMHSNSWRHGCNLA
jgi:predicted nuclease of predicted toxin-antitoxin system